MSSKQSITSDKYAAYLVTVLIAMHDLHAIELPPPRQSHIEEEGQPATPPKLTKPIAASTAFSYSYTPPAMNSWPTAKTFG